MSPKIVKSKNDTKDTISKNDTKDTKIQELHQRY